MAKKTTGTTANANWMQEIEAAATFIYSGDAPVPYMWESPDKHLRVYGRHLHALLETSCKRIGGLFPPGSGVPVFSCYWDQAPLPQKMIIVKLHLDSAKAHLRKALRILSRVGGQSRARGIVARLLASLQLNDGALNYHIRKVTSPFHVREAKRIVLKQYTVMANAYASEANRRMAEQMAFARTIRW